MIKGVNRQVVEVSEPENEYFEKVIFFVKPEYYGLGESKLRDRAGKMLGDSIRPPRTKTYSAKNRVKSFIGFAAAAAAGAGAASILSFIIH